jgi:hypothetical protein
MRRVLQLVHPFRDLVCDFRLSMVAESALAACGLAFGK